MVRAPYSTSAQSDILRRRRHFSSNSNLWKNLQNKYHSMLRRVSHLSWLPVHCLTATCPHQITSFDCLVGARPNREWHTTPSALAILRFTIISAGDADDPDRLYEHGRSRRQRHRPATRRDQTYPNFRNQYQSFLENHDMPNGYGQNGLARQCRSILIIPNQIQSSLWGILWDRCDEPILALARQTIEHHTNRDDRERTRCPRSTSSPTP